MIKRMKLGAKKKAREVFHFVIGIVFLLFSVVSLLAGMSGGDLVPYSLFSVYVLEIAVILFGLFFLRQAFYDWEENLLSFVLGIFLVLFGLLPLLNEYGLLNFLPVIFDLEANPFALAGILFLSSVFLIVDRYFRMFSERYS